jgi:hypothetical protein
MASIGFPERGAQVKRKADGLVGEVYERNPSKDLLTIRWSARSGHNTLVCTSEQFFRDWDLTGGARSSQIELFPTVMTLLAVGVLAVACIYGCSSFFFGPSEFRVPTSVLDEKTSAADGNPKLYITMKLRGIDGGVSDMSLSGQDMQEIVKHELKKNGSERSIVFHLVADGHDVYGQASQIQVFDIQYSMDDLRRINWANVTSNGLLNLGHVSEMSPQGADVAKFYCEKAREYAEVFCEDF